MPPSRPPPYRRRHWRRHCRLPRLITTIAAAVVGCPPSRQFVSPLKPPAHVLALPYPIIFRRPHTGHTRLTNLARKWCLVTTCTNVIDISIVKRPFCFFGDPLFHPSRLPLSPAGGGVSDQNPAVALRRAKSPCTPQPAAAPRRQWRRCSRRGRTRTPEMCVEGEWGGVAEMCR